MSNRLPSGSHGDSKPSSGGAPPQGRAAPHEGISSGADATQSTSKAKGTATTPTSGAGGAARKKSPRKPNFAPRSISPPLSPANLVRMTQKLDWSTEDGDRSPETSWKCRKYSAERERTRTSEVSENVIDPSTASFGLISLKQSPAKKKWFSPSKPVTLRRETRGSKLGG